MLSLQPLCLLLHILTLAVFTSAADLEFTAPNFNDNFKVSRGEEITIQWKSPFKKTTVVVYQSLPNSTTLFELLAVKVPESKTQTKWTAGGIGNHPILNSTFHFYLQDSSNSTCTKCNATSPNFTINKAAVSTTTKGPKFTADATNTPSNSPSSTAGASGSESAQRTKHQSSLPIELGAGLGAGVPAALAMIGIFAMWLNHRRKAARRGKDNVTDLSPEDSAPPTRRSRDAQMRQRENRESGALGPWGQSNSPSPTRSEEAAAARREKKHRSSQKYDYTPFRPSMFTHSESVDEVADSQTRINNFDFEQPEYRDSSADEMSQAQRSIHEAASRPHSEYTEHSALSQVSLAENDEPLVPQVPELPPAAHTYSTMGDNWPMR